MAKRKVTGDLSKTLKRIKNRRDDEEYQFNPQDQVEGIERRLEASGVDVEKAKDERPLHKKLLNLPKDQNILFDFFEIMNRPQSAMFGGLKALISEDESNVGKALLDGITGKEKTQFKNVLHEMGVEESEGTLGVDDVAGFVGDIFLDPLNYTVPGTSALVKFQKSGELEKAVKAAEEADKILKSLDKGQDYVDAVTGVTKSYAEIEKAADIANKALEASKLKNTTLSTRDLTVKQLATQKIGSGFKGMLTAADGGAVKLFNWIDEANEAKALKEGTKFKSIAQGYQGIKDSLTRTFNMKALLPEGFYAKYRQITGRKHFTEHELKLLVKTHLDGVERDLDNLYNAILSTGNANITRERMDKLVNIIYEYNVIGNDGSINLSNITLSNKSVKIKDVLTHKHKMFDSGFSESDKEAIEIFVETFMPEWYKENVLGDKSLATGMFVKGSEGELTDGTWRLARKEWLDVTTKNQTFVKEIDALGELDTTERMEKFLKSHHGINLDESKYREYHEYNQLKSEITNLERLLESGKTTILSKDSKLYGEYVTQSKRYKDTVAKMLELEDKINNHNESMGNILDLWREYEELAIHLDELKEANVGLIKSYKEGELQIKDVLRNMYEDLAHREASLNTDYLKFINGFLGDKEGQINLATTLNKKTISDIEYLVSNTFNELSEVTAGVYTAMETVANKVTEVFGTAYFEDMFTEDYFRHVVTEEWLNNHFRSIDASIMSSGDKTAKVASDLIGNQSAYKARRWDDAAAVANEHVQGYIDWVLDRDLIEGEALRESFKNTRNLQMFETDITKSVMDHIATSTKTTADAQVYRHVMESLFLESDEALEQQGRKMTDLVITMEDTKDVVIPKGFVSVESRDLVNKTKGLLGYFRLKGESQEEFNAKFISRMNSWLEKTKGKKVFIDKNIDRMIGRMTDKSEQGAFLSFMDSINGVFKKFKLLSPGFMFRSSVGNYSNMWLAGMDSKEIAKYSHAAYKDFKLAQKIADKVRAGLPVSAAEQKAVAIYNEFMQEGFGLIDFTASVKGYEDIAHALNVPDVYKPDKNHLPQHLLGKPKEVMDKFARFNLEKNHQIELMQRFTLFKYAKENPEWLRESNFASPAEAVRLVLYDYQDLSAVEQDVLKRIIPFYTFTKKNLGFQLQNLGKNTSRYHDLIKTYNSLWDVLDLDEDEQDTYKKESFWIPIPAMRNGKYAAIKSTLAVGDLGQFLNNPLHQAAASTAPIIRAPFEMAMNKQAFSGMPISEFKGQKGFQIPEISRTAEYGLNQLGLDVPATGVMNLVRAGRGVASGEISSVGQALETGLGRSLVSVGDPAKTSERKAYDRLDSMQELLRYYKQEGIEIMTLTEVNNREKFNSLEGRIQRLRAIRKR